MRKYLLAGVGLVAVLGVAYAQSPGINSQFNTVWEIPIDSIKRTYAVNVDKLSPAVSATDIFQICGAAGLTTKVTRIAVSGRASTVSPVDIYIAKYSTANSLSGATLTPVAYNAGFSTAQSKVFQYTSNPTLGTLVGVIAEGATWLGGLTTTQGALPLVFDWGGTRPAGAPTLTSASQCLSVNLSSQTNLLNVYDIQVEWTEEP